jgi:hypothetical protein
LVDVPLKAMLKDALLWNLSEAKPAKSDFGHAARRGAAVARVE